MKHTNAQARICQMADPVCPDLGPFPTSAVLALADLGLTDREIARYFATHPIRIAQIRLYSRPELQIANG